MVHGAPHNNQSLLSLAKFQGLKGYLPVPGEKVVFLCKLGQILSHTGALPQVLIPGVLPGNHPACSSLSLSLFEEANLGYLLTSKTILG